MPVERFEWQATTGPGEAAAIARQAAGTGRAVIAAGGDGTVNEVVNGLLEAGGTPLLAVLPLGSGNDFARALRALPFGLPSEIDVGVAKTSSGKRYFALGVGAGFIGWANRLHRGLNLPGEAGYLASAVIALVGYRLRPRVRLTIDGRVWTGRPSMVLASNTPTVGGGFRVAPRARLDDGLLDVAWAGLANPIRFGWLLQRARRGAHEGDRLVQIAQAATLTVESSLPWPVHVDGEEPWPGGVRRLEIGILAGALRVVRIEGD